MIPPNDVGGPTLNVNNLTNARPWGLGTISGFLTVLMYQSQKNTAFRADDVKIIEDFVRVYDDIYDNIEHLTHFAPYVSPLLVPLFNNSEAMTNRTRGMITLWNTVIAHFIPPHVDTSSGTTILTQLKFSSTQRYGLVAYPDPSAPKGIAYRIGDNDGIKNDIDFQKIHATSFGGSLFAALAYVHPQLPLLSASHGEISGALRKTVDGAHLVWKDTRGAAEFMCGVSAADVVAVNKARQMHADRVCTSDYALELNNHPLLRQFPRFVSHIIANPPVFHDMNHVTDFEVRLIQSFSKPLLAGIAQRALMYSQITLQTVRMMQQRNMRIPLSATLLRPHETQDAYSGYALASKNLGTTVFSGIDNNVSFDANSQHYSVQAFASTRTIVSDAAGYLELPTLRAGAYVGGKGHLFVNQDEPRPITVLEEVREAVQSCNGRELGDRSVIAVLSSYTSAVEPVRCLSFDVRNNYRRENFAGRLTNSAQDFQEKRADLAYCGAPILNLLFCWDNGEGSRPLDNQSLRQRLDGYARNYVVRLTSMEIWDEHKGLVRTPSYHIWGRLENDNLLYTQQSYSDVPDARI